MSGTSDLSIIGVAKAMDGRGATVHDLLLLLMSATLNEDMQDAIEVSSGIDMLHGSKSTSLIITGDPLNVAGVLAIGAELNRMGAVDEGS